MLKSIKTFKRDEMDCDRVKLVDIGNTNAKIYHNCKIEVIKASEFALKEKFFYICVNKSVNELLKNDKNAINLENYIELKTNYKGLGIDRKLLCSYIDDGVIVDAGSAITVDVMSKGKHLGGYILPGVTAFFNSYKSISSFLDAKRVDIDLKNLPQNTQEAINYGVFKSIVLMIKDISKDKKIYFCGGDGRDLSKYFDNSIFKDDLIFEAMKKIVREKVC